MECGLVQIAVCAVVLALQSFAQRATQAALVPAQVVETKEVVVAVPSFREFLHMDDLPCTHTCKHALAKGDKPCSRETLDRGQMGNDRRHGIPCLAPNICKHCESLLRDKGGCSV